MIFVQLCQTRENRNKRWVGPKDPPPRKSGFQGLFDWWMDWQSRAHLSSSTGGTPLPGIPPAIAKERKLCNSYGTLGNKNLFAKVILDPVFWRDFGAWKTPIPLASVPRCLKHRSPLQNDGAILKMRQIRIYISYLFNTANVPFMGFHHSPKLTIGFETPQLLGSSICSSWKWLDVFSKIYNHFFLRSSTFISALSQTLFA